MDIAAAMRAQMIGQLLDALSTSAGKTTAPADTPKLTPGQTLAATVLGEGQGAKLFLRIGGTTLAADISGATLPAAARQPGAELRLTVTAGGETPRLALASFTPGPAGAMMKAPAQAIQNATQAAIISSEPPAARPSPPEATALQTALRDAMGHAVQRQGSAAPLYANLAALTAAHRSNLPEAVTRIAQMLTDTRLAGDRPITAEAVRQAVAAAASPGSALTPDAADGLDIRTLLATLKATLPVPAEAEVPRRDMPPEPPRRDGAPAPQKPALPTLPPDADVKSVAATLFRETEQALERAKLHAYAGLPDQRPAVVEGPRPQQFAFELPVALGQQTAMAGFKVERDPHQARGPDGEPMDVWGIRFAIETDEIGAVHAHLRLSGRALSVSLWAEDQATRTAFTEALPLLEAALRDGALDVGDLAIFAGRPHGPRLSGAGRLLDVSS